MPTGATTWHVTGAGYSEASLPTPAELDGDFTSAATLAFEDEPTSGLEKRLLSEQRILYWNDALTAPLAHGAVGSRLLPYERYHLACTAGLRTEVFGTDVTASMRSTEGAYVDLDSNGDDWVPSGRMTLDASHFYQPSSHTDPWGNTSTLTWDTHRLTVTSATNAAGLTTSSTVDYRTLAATTVTAPNNTTTEAAFDALGRVVATAIRNGSDGDAPGDWSATFSYEVHRFVNSGDPVRVVASALTEHGGTTWLTRTAYMDGGGNVVQEKVPAAPGLAPERDGSGDLVFDGNGDLQLAHASPRYVGNGRTVLNNKGNPVKQYEPFFSASSDYETEVDLVEWGVSAVTSYDPLGRAIAVTLPDGSQQTTSFDPWHSEARDENDNDASSPHYDTPVTTHTDALGRPIRVDVTPDGGTTTHTTRTVLDITGNPTAVVDARGNTIQEQRFDLLARPLFTGAADEGYDPSSPSTDKGHTRTFTDISGQPMRSWRSGSLTLRRTYDVLRRPVALFANEGSGETLVEHTAYGDAFSDTPSNRFADGLPLEVLDTAGRMSLTYDFRGRTVSQTRTVTSDITATIDWSGVENQTTLATYTSWLSTNGGLSSESFTTTQSHDALDRVVETTSPDGTRHVPTYDEGSRLDAMTLYVRGSLTGTDVVSSITYNARGQRDVLTRSNHTTTTYSYDPERFRLTDLVTTRSASSPNGAATLQNLSFTYDRVGNILSITDDAQETLYFGNSQVSPYQTEIA